MPEKPKNTPHFGLLHDGVEILGDLTCHDIDMIVDQLEAVLRRGDRADVFLHQRLQHFGIDVAHEGEYELVGIGEEHPVDGTQTAEVHLVEQLGRDDLCTLVAVVEGLQQLLLEEVVGVGVHVLQITLVLV